MMTVERPHITVVSQQSWRADELRPYATVRTDFGLDTNAAEDPTAALWCPGAWAAAAAVRHPHLRLSSAGPRWLDNLPLALSGRETLTDCAANWIRMPPATFEPRIFAKLPETKHELFPAGLRSVGLLVTELALLPGRELVSMQTPVHFTDEVRCWVLGGAVVAHTPYFHDVDRDEWNLLHNAARSASAAQWLGHKLSDGSVTAPPAVVIDVAWCIDPVVGAPGWRIVEANAAWSSDWYAAEDLAAVLDTVLASQHEVSDRWRWQPSPLLVDRSVALARR